VSGNSVLSKAAVPKKIQHCTTATTKLILTEDTLLCFREQRMQ